MYCPSLKHVPWSYVTFPGSQVLKGDNYATYPLLSSCFPKSLPSKESEVWMVRRQSHLEETDPKGHMQL